MLRNACYLLIFLSFLRRFLWKLLPSSRPPAFMCTCPIPFEGTALCLGFELVLGSMARNKRLYIPLKQVPNCGTFTSDGELDDIAARYGLKTGVSYFWKNNEYVYIGFYYKRGNNEDGNRPGAFVRTIPDIQPSLDYILSIVRKVLP